MSVNKDKIRQKESRCNVRNCSRNINVSLHTLPDEKYPERRQLWMEALELHCNIRGKFNVCSQHFKESDFKQGYKQKWLQPSAVPSLNLPNSLQEEPPLNLRQDVPLTQSFDSTESALNDRSYELLEEDELLISFESDCEELTLEEEDDTMQQIVIATSDAGTQTRKVELKDKNIQTNLAYDEHLKPWSFVDVLDNDSDLQSWTGIQRSVTVDNIVNCLMRLESAQEHLSSMRISPRQMVVLILIKLKTNLTFKQISCLFSISAVTLVSYFEKGLPMLKAVLEPVIFWPSKEQVENNLPQSFKSKFGDCYAVMDCTETPIERLQSLESKIKTYSHYKGCHTGKINITITPSGLIVNVTRAYGGKASDKFIILKEKVIENISSGSGVMTDKGYDIQKETSAKGIKLYRPPILDKPQHTKEEAIYNTDVATSRIHVERVIQRLKVFNIFRGKMGTSTLKHIDDIVFVACAITNLNSPVLSDDKF